MSRIDYEDYEHDSDCKILQTSALKIQNPDASTLRVLSKKEEKMRNKSLHRLVRKDGDRRAMFTYKQATETNGHKTTEKTRKNKLIGC